MCLSECRHRRMLSLRYCSWSCGRRSHRRVAQCEKGCRKSSVFNQSVHTPAKIWCLDFSRSERCAEKKSLQGNKKCDENGAGRIRWAFRCNKVCRGAKRRRRKNGQISRMNSWDSSAFSSQYFCLSVILVEYLHTNRIFLTIMKKGG